MCEYLLKPEVDYMGISFVFQELKESDAMIEVSECIKKRTKLAAIYYDFECIFSEFRCC
jgi:hypothetical protein